MDNNTPFHENHERPAGFSAPPPPPAPSKNKIPVWAVALGVLLLGLIVALVVLFSTQGDKKEAEAAPAPAVTVTATATPEPTKEPTREAKPEPAWSVPAPKELTTQDRKPAVMTEAQFLAFLRDTFPALTEVPDEEIMHHSDQSCDLFEDGKSPEDVLIKMTDKVTSADEAEAMGGIVGASVSNYCTAYADEVETYLNEMGVQPAPQGA